MNRRQEKKKHTRTHPKTNDKSFFATGFYKYPNRFGGQWGRKIYRPCSLKLLPSISWRLETSLHWAGLSASFLVSRMGQKGCCALSKVIRKGGPASTWSLEPSPHLPGKRHSRGHAEPEAEAWDHSVTDLPKGRLQPQPLSDCSHREDSSENHPAEPSACRTMQCYRKFRVVTKWSVQLLSHVRLCVTPWTAAYQASLSITNSQSLLKLISIELVMHPTIPYSVIPFSSCPHSATILFQWIISSHPVAKALEPQLQYQSFQWLFWTDFL